MYKAEKNLSKIKGCLFGGAAGDALGYTVEFMKYAEIVSRYGREGITSYELTDGLALISDDTQMTLFTANGLIYGLTRGILRGIMGQPYLYCGYAYLDWYRTQTGDYDPDKYRYTWLYNVKELRSRRAPGMTCLSALSRGQKGMGSIERPVNNSKGCGGIMRVAPIGLYLPAEQEIIDKNGACAAALTHGHELGYLPAAMLVHIISKIHFNCFSISDAVDDALSAIQEDFPKTAHLKYLVELIERAVSLSKKNMNDVDAISQLGEGWVAEETLAIAVYCSLKYSDDFRKGIIAAVNHDGDSDSTGSVCGNILGCSLGYEAIPEEFITNLELKDVIGEIADDLYRECPLEMYSESADPVWVSKYIECDYSPAIED